MQDIIVFFQYISSPRLVPLPLPLPLPSRRRVIRIMSSPIRLPAVNSIYAD